MRGLVRCVCVVCVVWVRCEYGIGVGGWAGQQFEG